MNKKEVETGMKKRVARFILAALLIICCMGGTAVADIGVGEAAGILAEIFGVEFSVTNVKQQARLTAPEILGKNTFTEKQQYWLNSVEKSGIDQWGTDTVWVYECSAPAKVELTSGSILGFIVEAQDAGQMDSIEYHFIKNDDDFGSDASGSYMIINEPGVYVIQPNSIWLPPPFVVIVSDGVREPMDEPTPDTLSGWAVDAVSRANSLGLVPQHLNAGYTQTMTRAEFCALAVRLYETIKNTEITERMTFVDTEDVNVQKMGALSVVTGVGNNRFAPNDLLTREQAATMIARLAEALDNPLSGQAPAFTDNNSISSWAYDAVGKMQATGIMDGVGNNTFSPKGSYTREQSIATMLRLFDVVG